MKAEVLAARANRLWNILRLGGRHHEDNMVGRLLQCFQKRIERSIGDLVRLVQNVDFVAVARRAVPGSVAQFADFIDAAVGRGIDFDHVDGVALADLQAGVAGQAWLGRGPLRGANETPAIQRGRKDTRDGRLADATMAAEDVAVRNAVLLQRILQRAGDVVLAHDIAEAERAVFAGKDLVGHRPLVYRPGFAAREV